MSRFYLATLVMLTAGLAHAQDAHVHDHAATPDDTPQAVSATQDHESAASVAEPMAMDHIMPTGSDDPPDDARDPHANSGGFTRTGGPYALADVQHETHGIQEPVFSIFGDRAEYDPDANAGAYEIQAWRGTSFNRLILKSEGSFARNDVYANQTELLWGRAFSPFWDSQLGLRVDSVSEGKDRQWLAAGIQGLAPYWFELDVTAYLGNEGQSEVGFNSEYEWLLTQRLILQPRVEFTVRGKNDPANLLGSGLANASFSLRLRYEFSRQFAPFIGVETHKSYGNTADLLRTAGEKPSDSRYFAGIRFWF